MAAVAFDANAEGLTEGNTIMADTNDVSNMDSSGMTSTSDGDTSSVANGGCKSPIVFVIEEEKVVRQKTRRVNKASRSDQAGLLSSVYAILLVLFGLLFPLTEAITHTWLQDLYSAVFLVYIFTVGTVFLVYLQINIVLESKAKKKKAAEYAVCTTPAAGGEKKGNTVTLGTSRMTGLTPRGEEGGLSVISTCNPSPSDTPRVKRRRHRSYESEMTTEISDGAYTFDLDAIKNIFAHEGSSFYLRLGAMVFSIGVMIYIGLELELHLDSSIPESCNPAKYGWTFVFHLVFVLVQTFFIFKHPQVHITKHAPLGKFGFMHLIATNLCVWLRTLTNEIQEEFHHKMAHDDPHNDYSNTTDEIPVDPCEEESKLLRSASPYLFPFVLEYSLIAAGVAAIMYEEIGVHKRTDMIQSIKNALKARAAAQDSAVLTVREHAPGEVALHKAHRGMFLGVMLLAGMIICIILFSFHVGNDNNDTALMIYLVSDIVMHTVMLIGTWIGLYQLNKLYHTHKAFSVDDVLLLLSMSGSFLFEMSLAVSTGIYVHDNGGDVLQIMSMAASILAGVYIICQVIFVMGGLRKYSATRWQIKHMPGRETTTFMIIGNVTLWIFRTMQVKELELGVQEEIFGTLAWLLLMNLNLPLLLFFHFHSSVCLADIWHIAYYPLHRKLDTRRDNQPEMTNDVFSTQAQSADAATVVRGAARVLRKQNPNFSYANPDVSTRDESETEDFKSVL